MEAGSTDLVFYFLYTMTYVWCAACFVKRHLKGSRSQVWSFAGLLFCGCGLLDWFQGESGIPYILYAVCRHLMLLFLILMIFWGEREKKFLTAVILEAMMILICNFSESLLSCGGLFLAHRLSGGRQMTMSVWMEQVILCITCATEIMSVGRLSGALAPVLESRRKSWYLCLGVPLAGLILITDVANWAASNGILVQGRGRYGVYENQLFSHGAMCVFTGLAMGAAAFFVFGMDRIDREERLRDQYQAQVMYYQMLEEQYGRMERLRHDMKNHMIALEHLVKNRRWEQAGSYLQEMAKAGSVETGEEATGSLVMDALLCHKRRQAAAEGICWQCDVRLSKDMPVNEMDLCIIAGNMLDNAVEASIRYGETGAEQPFIYVYMGTVKKCLLLEVRNRTHLTGGPETGRSEKEDPKGHGLGLSNIQATAAAYNGAVHVDVEEGVFTISVLLPLCPGKQEKNEPYTA